MSCGGGYDPKSQHYSTHAIATILSLQHQQTHDFKTQSTKYNFKSLSGTLGGKKSDFQQIGYLKDIPKQNRHPTKNKKHRYGFKPRSAEGKRLVRQIRFSRTGEARRNLRQPSYLSLACAKVTGVHHHTQLHDLAFCNQLNLVYAHLKHRKMISNTTTFTCIYI